MSKRVQGRRRRGNTLLEVIAASTILATALVPALRIMGRSLEVSRDLETANMMSTYCVSKLEEELALTSIDWRSGSSSGDFSSDGYSEIRYFVEKSDATADGGIAGELMAITVTVYADENGNNSHSVGEPSVVFATKLAKNDAYLNL